MATMKTDAQKVTELRKQAQDKSLPQEVRDMADKKANAIEGKSVEKATGMKLAKGGMPVRGERTATNKAKKMMYGGMAEKTMMAKGGAVMAAGNLSPRGAVTGGPLMKPKPMAIGTAAGSLSPRGAVTGGALVKPKQVTVKPSARPITKALATPMNTKPVKPLNPTMMAKGGSVKKAKK